MLQIIILGIGLLAVMLGALTLTVACLQKRRWAMQLWGLLVFCAAIAGAAGLFFLSIPLTTP